MSWFIKVQVITQLLMKPGRVEFFSDFMLMLLSAYLNFWDQFAWFGSVIIPNVVFEIWFFVDMYKDMPDIIITTDHLYL